MTELCPHCHRRPVRPLAATCSRACSNGLRMIARAEGRPPVTYSREHMAELARRSAAARRVRKS